jgi:hypothetical protein
MTLCITCHFAEGRVVSLSKLVSEPRPDAGEVPAPEADVQSGPGAEKEVIVKIEIDEVIPHR